MDRLVWGSPKPCLGEVVRSAAQFTMRAALCSVLALASCGEATTEGPSSTTAESSSAIPAFPESMLRVSKDGDVCFEDTCRSEILSNVADDVVLLAAFFPSPSGRGEARIYFLPSALRAGRSPYATADDGERFPVAVSATGGELYVELPPSVRSIDLVLENQMCRPPSPDAIFSLDCRNA